MTRIALLVACIIVTPIGNLLLKSGMNQCGSIAETHLGVVQYYLNVFSKPQVLVGTVLYIASALMWLAVLGMMDISTAYPIFVAGAFTIVTVAAIVLFREHVNFMRVLGIVVVIAGIFIVSQSARWGTGQAPAASAALLSGEVQNGNYGGGVEDNIDH